MSYIPGLEAVQAALRGEAHDLTQDRVLQLVNESGRVSPQHVADVLRIGRVEAKAKLQSLASNGLIKATPTGWYEAGSLTNFQI